MDLPRLRSLDALRGFDMLWIVGLADLFHQLAAVIKVGWLDALVVQLEHVPWEGLRVYDLIFPLFMFLSGISVPYALGRKAEVGTGKKLAGVWKRVLVLVLFGCVYNGLLSFRFESQRYASVLGQIGVAYGIAATIFLMTSSWRVRGGWCAGILAMVAALQLGFPVPGHGAGVLTPEGVVNAWLDRLALPGRLHGGSFDPEGLLCIVSASALTLGGVLTGDFLRRLGAPSYSAAARLLVVAVVLWLAGMLCWKLGYPPIKAAWTTSFNLLAGGICLGLFTIFHVLIDFGSPSRWSLPLEVVGMNSLTIYLLEKVVPFPMIAEFFGEGLMRWSGSWGEVVLVVFILLIEWILLWFLWRKKIFLRV